MPMNDNGDIALVIDRTALIENLLNQVIENFCGPRKEAFLFFWSILLDSSIMPMGSKVKAAMAISQELEAKLDQNAIHILVSLRNAFAHHSVNSHPTLLVGETPEQDQVHFTLQIISNSGKVSHKRRDDALAEFHASFDAAKESLSALILLVQKKLQSGRDA
jgi:hypothetical protein